MSGAGAGVPANPAGADARASGAAAGRRAWIGALLAGLVSAELMRVRLGDPGLWCDEIYTARWTRLAVPALLRALATDLHPPLFFLIERLFAHSLGEGEAALRLLPLLAGAATVVAAFWAFRPTLGTVRAVAVAWVLALAPGLALYSRMARYYSLAALTAVIAHGVFVRLEKSDAKGRAWALYAVAVAAALATSYLSLALIAAHGVWAWASGRPRKVFVRWALASTGAAALLAPWALVAGRQVATAHGVSPALVGGLEGWALMLGYELHALAAGEVLFPWEPAGAVALLCGVALMARGWAAARREALSRALLLPGATALAIASLLVAFLARGTPFVSLPARALWLWPFAAALAVVGAGKGGGGRLLAAGGPASALFGWLHLYDSSRNLNPIYLTPGREAAVEILRSAGSADAVLAEDDTGVGYYLERLAFPGPIVDPADTLALDRVLSSRPPVLWWARLSRDGSARGRPETAILFRILQWGTVERRTRYGRVDPVLRDIKRRLLHTPGYAHRLEIERYVVRPG